MSRAVKLVAFVLIFGLFAVSVWAGVIAAQVDPATGAATTGSPTSGNQLAILITTIAGFASLLATQMFQFYRENRNRKWDLQDRSLARAEIRSVAETQRLEMMQAAIELARVSNINRDHLLGAIKENTEITTHGVSKAEAAAYSAADNFNYKFETLQNELKDMGKNAPEPSTKKDV